jgi:hypothetical protein
MEYTSMGILHNMLSAGKFANIEQVKTYIEKIGLKNNTQEILKSWESGYEEGVNYNPDREKLFAWAKAEKYLKKEYKSLFIKI